MSPSLDAGTYPARIESRYAGFINAATEHAIRTMTTSDLKRGQIAPGHGVYFGYGLFKSNEVPFIRAIEAILLHAVIARIGGEHPVVITHLQAINIGRGRNMRRNWAVDFAFVDIR